MIRVLHVIDKMSVQGSGLHGIARALAWWCARMDKAEFHVRVLSLRGHEQEAADLFEPLGLDLKFVDLGKFDLKTLPVLIREARDFQADILHLHGYAATNFGRLAGAWLRKPVIVHEHVVFPKQPLYQDIADRLLAPLTTHALAISEPVAGFMRDKRHIPARKLETFFYGIPFDEFVAPEPATVDAARAQTGFPAGVPILVTAGRLAEQKDLPTLLQALTLLDATVRLVIVGEGPERETVVRLARETGFMDRIYLTGFQKDVRPWLALADVFVIPSRYEGGPLTLFEAMHLGIPVVATPVGLVPEVLRDGENGFIVPIGDASALAAAVSRIVDDASLRETLSQTARRDSGAWDVQPAVDRVCGVYRRLSR